MSTRREFIALLGGATTGWPLAARAQQMRSPYRIGFLGLLPGENTSTFMKSFLERLNELGYREGYNMIFDYRSAEGASERLPQLAADAVRASPDVLVTGFGTLVAMTAKDATSTIPIVFTAVADPVGAGLVASLGRPGANVTGMSAQASDIVGKRLQILQELVPSDKAVAVLLNPETPFSASGLRELRATTQAGPTALVVFEARTADQVSAGFEAAVKARAAGLVLLDESPAPASHRARGQVPNADDIHSQGFPRGWRIGVLRYRCSADEPSCRRTRGQDTQGSQTGRSASRATDQI